MPGRHSRAPARLRGPVALVVAAVVAAGAVLACAVAGGPADRAGVPPEDRAGAVAEPAGGARPGGPPPAVAVLRRWDRERSRAWARGDEGALRRLYLPGSEVAERDVAMLRQWSARGLRVRRIRMQLLATDTRVRSADRLVLVVTDRLASAVASRVGTGSRPGVRLPRDGVSTRRLVLRRTPGGWVVASVRDLTG